MRSGSLRNKINIEHAMNVKNSVGEQTKTWSIFAEVYAEAKPIRSTERFVSQRLQTEVNFQFRVRFLSGIEHDMRVVYNERIFDIDSVLNVEERNKELIILASEVL